MGSWYDIKSRGTWGPGEDEVQEITILGRILRYREWGLEYEADPKHRKLICSRQAQKKRKL